MKSKIAPPPVSVPDHSLNLLLSALEHDAKEFPDTRWFMEPVSGEVLMFSDCGPERPGHRDSAQPPATPHTGVSRLSKPLVPVEPLSPGDRVKTLRQFLASPWTSDHWRIDQARAAFAGNIDQWLQIVDDATATAYREFRDRDLTRRAALLLAPFGHRASFTSWTSP